MQAAEQDKQSEEDIDISDEAQTFKPVKVCRDEPDKRHEAAKSEETDEANSGKIDGEDEKKKQPYHRPGYREAIMTDGILVEDIIHEIDKLAETGTSDLGTVIYTCENAR